MTDFNDDNTSPMNNLPASEPRKPLVLRRQIVRTGLKAGVTPVSKCRQVSIRIEV